MCGRAGPSLEIMVQHKNAEEGEGEERERGKDIYAKQETQR